MGFRFRRSFRIAPGVRLNVGKRSLSVSAGVRGARITAGTSGVRRTLGIPGTGLSHTKVIGGADQRDTPREPSSALTPSPAFSRTRLLRRNPFRTAVGFVALGSWVASPVMPVLAAIAVGMTLAWLSLRRVDRAVVAQLSPSEKHAAIEASHRSLVAPPISPDRPHGKIAAVGESHYQRALRDLLKTHPGRDVLVAVSCEPTNEHDPNAVVIRDVGNDETLAYLPRAIAKDLCGPLSEAGTVVCSARLHGGEAGKPSIGIVLDGDSLKAKLAGRSW